MSSGRVAGVVLAAGAATRLDGAPKAVLPFEGRTIIETVLDTARKAGLDPLVVVVSADDVAVRNRLAASDSGPDYLTVNHRSSEGIAGSVAMGIRAVIGAAVDAAAVLLADEPGMRVEWIRRLVRAWSEAPSEVARARYTDRPGHPVLLPRSVFGRVAVISPRARVLPELQRGGVRVRSVSIRAPAPIDVDTARDYDRALRRSQPVPFGPDGTFPVAAGPRESPRR